MKRIIIFCVTILFYVCSFAQAPQKMSYQAVIRNSSNTLVINTQVGMQISILQGSASGTAVYVETQTPTSNANGLVSLEVGAGTVVSGTFASINWANGPYFIKTETDPAGGTNYTITGTSQLLSVPYALHAKTAETLTGNITESDPLYLVLQLLLASQQQIPPNGILIMIPPMKFNNFLYLQLVIPCICKMEAL
jgi:hypothetical protein